MKTLFIPLLLVLVACGTPPCPVLATAIAVAQDGVVVAEVVCPCLSFDATAELACKAAAEGLVIGEDAAKEAYAMYCTNGDAGPKATPKLRTRPQFDEYFAAHKAQKAARK